MNKMMLVLSLMLVMTACTKKVEEPKAPAETPAEAQVEPMPAPVPTPEDPNPTPSPQPEGTSQYPEGSQGTESAPNL